MLDFSSYALSDFLLFSPRVYFRLLELRNVAHWPAQFVTIAAGLATIWLMFAPTRRRYSVALLMCGGAWIWLGWSFFWKDYATINWAAAYFAPIAALQGALLIGCAAIGLQPYAGRGATSYVALAVLTFAVVGYPLLAPLSGRPLLAADVIGISPDPTAVATVAVLALTQSRVRWLLLAIPIVWCILTGLTHFAMETTTYFAAPASALAAIFATVTLSRQQGNRSA